MGALAHDHRPAAAAAVLCGAASGGRTFTGLAALAVTGPLHARDEPDRTLARPGIRLAIALAALGELAADKLPQAPSRLAFPGSAGRAVTAAVCGIVAARRAAARGAAPDRGPDPLTPPPRTPPGPGPDLPAPGGSPAAPVVAGAALTGVAAAGLWAVAGVRWRRWAAERTGHDWIGALAEDAAVVTLAALGAERVTR